MGHGAEGTVSPQVSVIVPTRDRPEQLAACLVALERQQGVSIEAVVVDDRSSEPSAVDAVVDASPIARVVRGRGSGPAAARNLGAAAATSGVLCFTDDDCRADPEWAATLAARMGGGAPAVAGATLTPPGASPQAVAAQAITNHLTLWGRSPSGTEVAFAPTSNLACTAELARSLPFDEGFPLAAGEDRDWCSRLAGAGHALAYEPAAIVWHHQALTLRGFWRQQVRYGRGAHRWHRTRPSGQRLQPPAFYAGLVGRGFSHGLGPGALVVMAQLATAAGVVIDLLAARKDGREAEPGGLRR